MHRTFEVIIPGEKLAVGTGNLVQSAGNGHTIPRGGKEAPECQSYQRPRQHKTDGYQ